MPSPRVRRYDEMPQMIGVGDAAYESAVLAQHLMTGERSLIGNYAAADAKS